MCASGSSPSFVAARPPIALHRLGAGDEASCPCTACRRTPRTSDAVGSTGMSDPEGPHRTHARGARVRADRRRACTSRTWARRSSHARCGAEVDRRQAQVQQRTTTAKSIGQVAVVRRADGAPTRRARGRQCAPARAVVPRRDRRQRRARADAGAGVRRPPAARAERDRTRPIARPVTNGAAPAGRLAADPGLRRAVGVAGGRAPRRALAGRARAVRTYEGAHRNRRTILGKIDQISA